MRQLSGQDATFLFLETQAAYLHLSGLYIYDQSCVPGGALSHKDVLNHIASRLNTSTVFRQKLLSVPFNLDFPYWVDDANFDIEFHVRHIALPSPRDWRQLCILVARLHSRQLDMSKPPWEMYVIEGLDNIEGLSKGCFAILAKYHHAAVDGVTGNEILGGLHDTTTNTSIDAEPPPWRPEAPPSLGGLMARAAVSNVRTPFRLARAVAASLPGLSRSLLGWGQQKPQKRGPVPKTRFNRKVSPHRVFEGQTFNLSDFSQIRKAINGATVNDVVLAVCGGALRMYLEHHKELPDSSLVAMAPINVRSQDDHHIEGNLISGMLTPLHTEVIGPLERLRAIHAETKNAKELEGAVSARQMTDINQHIPASTLALAGRLVTGLGLTHQTIRLCNCVVTNVPGPQIPLYLSGAEMVHVSGCGPIIDGAGLIILAASYNRKLFFSFTSCRDIMPDPEFFSKCLWDSFSALRSSARKKTQGKRRKSKNSKD
jgi:WS/DGAT/MGAT family acyltransferase